jgi:hypothetical protein
VIVGVCIDPKKLGPEKKDTVMWPAMFFGGFKLQSEKITTGKKRYSHLAVSWKLEKITSGKKGTVVWSSVGAQNTKHNTHHRHNNQ